MRKIPIQTTIPSKIIGPINIEGELIDIPFSTLETTLFYSVDRGTKVSREINGLSVFITKDCMTRSAIFEAQNVGSAINFVKNVEKFQNSFQNIINKYSKFTKFLGLYTKIIGRTVFLRFEFDTSDASGHNMTTLATSKITEILTQQFELPCISISGNICTDKKVSAINSILGRGKSVIVEGIISKQICIKNLKTTPKKIVELNNKKNLLGSIVAGSTCSANSHFANMLLAFYLATGQDAANIVEGSQGITTAEMKEEDLYFSVSVPNIIVGTIGNGKNIDFVKQNLALMKCQEIESSSRLAKIAAATVWCGELSLISALTNENELIKSHIIIER